MKQEAGIQARSNRGWTSLMVAVAVYGMLNSIAFFWMKEPNEMLSRKQGGRLSRLHPNWVRKKWF